MEKTTKLSVIGLGLSTGLAWGLAVLAGGILAIIFSGWANVLLPGAMNQATPTKQPATGNGNGKLKTVLL